MSAPALHSKAPAAAPPAPAARYGSILQRHGQEEEIMDKREPASQTACAATSPPGDGGPPDAAGRRVRAGWSGSAFNTFRTEAQRPMPRNGGGDYINGSGLDFGRGGGLRLQRKCACGSPAPSGAVCPDCAKKKRELQRKLVVGDSNDPLEREADQVAGRVLSASPAGRGQRAPVQVQRAAGGTAGAGIAAPASVEQVLAGPGHAMPQGLRQDMEGRFGHDFSRVRLHTGSAAEQSAHDVDALAYTVGRNVVFGSGAYDPHSRGGQRLLAHELAHVVQQGEGTPLVQRVTTRGAGGCASLDSIDEDENGPKGAGSTAHSQIQSFLLPRILSEVEIPRATKKAMSSTGCQKDTVESGRADLYLRGGLNHEIAEIKPIRHDMSHAQAETDHYMRRAGQSLDRFFGSGTICPGAGKGTDDTGFASRIKVSKMQPSFARMAGILSTDTVIGKFDGDSSRTLKARLHAPGAVGYWCTGGKSDTFTCGASESAIEEFIEKVALSPAQSVLDDFLRDAVEKKLTEVLDKKSLGEILAMAEKHLGASIRNQLKPHLGTFADTIISKASAEEVGRLIEEKIGPEARNIVVTLIRRLTSLIVAELRTLMKKALAGVIREALKALCVGAPVVALADLMDRVRKMLGETAKALIPAAIAAAAVSFATLLAQELAAMLSELTAALGRALGALGDALAFIADKILRLLAAVVVLLLAVGVAILAVLALIAIFDPVPGDEIALGAASALLASLIPIMIRYVSTGSTKEEPDAT